MPIVKELSKQERRKISERVRCNKDVSRYRPESRSSQLADRRRRSASRTEEIKQSRLQQEAQKQALLAEKFDSKFRKFYAKKSRGEILAM